MKSLEKNTSKNRELALRKLKKVHDHVKSTRLNTISKHSSSIWHYLKWKEFQDRHWHERCSIRSNLPTQWPLTVFSYRFDRSVAATYSSFGEEAKQKRASDTHILNGNICWVQSQESRIQTRFWRRISDLPHDVVNVEICLVFVVLNSLVLAVNLRHKYNLACSTKTWFSLNSSGMADGREWSVILPAAFNFKKKATN